MAAKPRQITVAGQKVLVDDDGIPLVWPTIMELFEKNHGPTGYNLTDAQIAQIVTKVCRKDFPTATVRIYRHKYNRGDFTGGKAPKRKSRAISATRRSRLNVGQVRSLRTLIKMQQACAAPSGKGAADSGDGGRTDDGGSPRPE